MLKWITMLGLAVASLMAEVKHLLPDAEFFQREMKIIDIRTEPEWRETGIVEGAYTLTFFDERGRYDAEQFFSALDAIVTPGEEFALICRTSSRTTTIAPLFEMKGYNAINLKGGIFHVRDRLKIPLVPWKRSGDS